MHSSIHKSLLDKNNTERKERKGKGEGQINLMLVSKNISILDQTQRLSEEDNIDKRIFLSCTAVQLVS